jgi:hypothetical protein
MVGEKGDFKHTENGFVSVLENEQGNEADKSE